MAPRSSPPGSPDTLRQASEFLSRAAAAREHGQFSKALQLEQQARSLLDQGSDASANSKVSAKSRFTRANVAPARNLAIGALTEMRVPAPPREIADFHQARYGQPLDVRALASVRRDEERAFRRVGHRRAVYLTPALDSRFFQPVRGALTLSTWPLEERLVGPTSARTDHLRLAINIAGVAAEMTGRLGDHGAALLELAVWYAETVPGALPGGVPDPELIVAAAEVELSAIGDADSSWRVGAAKRAREQLSDHEQLWGSAIEGGIGLVARGGEQ